MRITPNYKLYKPDYDDAADIDFLNRNADILDDEIKKIELLTGNQAPVKSVNGKYGDIVIDAKDIELNNKETVQEHADKVDEILQGGSEPVSLTIDSPGVVSPANMLDGIISVESIEGNTLVNLVNYKNVDNGGSTGSTKSFDEQTKTVILTPNAVGSAVAAFGTTFLKPDRIYTAIFYLECEQTCLISTYSNKRYDYTTTVPCWSGFNVKKFSTFGATEPMSAVTIGYHGSADKKVLKISKLIVLEGDYTNKPLPSYFEGIKSLDSCVVKSVGKNLIQNGNSENGLDYWKEMSGSLNLQISLEDNAIKVTGSQGSDRAESNFILVDKTKNYYLSSKFKPLSTSATPLYIRYYDSNFKYISEQNYGFKNFDLNQYTNIGYRLNIPSNCKYVKVNLVSFGNPNGGYFREIQLEEGTTATNYEPYKEDKISILNSISGDKSLKRLPNGVADSISYDGVLTRRVKTLILDGTLKWIFNRAEIGFKIVAVPLPSPSVNMSAKVFKYNNNELIPDTTKVDAFSLYDSYLYITIANTDSGWGDNYTPTPNEIGAYFYGWRMSQTETLDPYNGEGIKCWVKITDYNKGVAAGTGTFILPNYTYAEYTPYHIYYQLTEPTTEQIVYGGIQSFKWGSLYTETSIPTKMSINYPTVLSNRLTNVEQELDRALDGLDQCFQFASEGKSLVSRAVNDSGIPATPEDTLPTLADKIRLIPGGGTPPPSDCPEGRKLIAEAITKKGVSASRNDDFPTLANKIGQIETSNICPPVPPITGKYITTIGTRVSDGSSMMPIYFDPGLGFDPSLIVVTFYDDIQATVSGGRLDLVQPTVIWSKPNGIYGQDEWRGNTKVRASIGMVGTTQLEFVGTPTRRQIVLSLSTTGNFVPDIRYQFKVIAFE